MSPGSGQKKRRPTHQQWPCSWGIHCDWNAIARPLLIPICMSNCQHPDLPADLLWGRKVGDWRMPTTINCMSISVKHNSPTMTMSALCIPSRPGEAVKIVYCTMMCCIMRRFWQMLPCRAPLHLEVQLYMPRTFFKVPLCWDCSARQDRRT